MRGIVSPGDASATRDDAIGLERRTSVKIVPRRRRDESHLRALTHRGITPPFPSLSLRVVSVGHQEGSQLTVFPVSSHLRLEFVVVVGGDGRRGVGGEGRARHRAGERLLGRGANAPSSPQLNRHRRNAECELTATSVSARVSSHAKNARASIGDARAGPRSRDDRRDRAEAAASYSAHAPSRRLGAMREIHPGKLGGDDGYVSASVARDKADSLADALVREEGTRGGRARRERRKTQESRLDASCQRRRDDEGGARDDVRGGGGERLALLLSEGGETRVQVLRVAVSRVDVVRALFAEDARNGTGVSGFAL